jgi:hypothetical protein
VLIELTYATKGYSVAPENKNYIYIFCFPVQQLWQGLRMDEYGEGNRLKGLPE